MWKIVCVRYVLEKGIGKKIIEDTEMLHLCKTTTIFKSPPTLFMKKWNSNPMMVEGEGAPGANNAFAAINKPI